MAEKGGGSNSAPLVSVLTPAYNEEAFLAANLKSVKRQTYENIEHIVVDDGSTDATPEILASYESEYNLRWESKDNEGLAPTLNRAAELAEGEYVVWLNADDVLYDTDTLKTVAEAFQTSPNADFLYGSYALIDADGQVRYVQAPFPWFQRDQLTRTCYGAFIFMRREVLAGGGLNTAIKHVPDYELYLRNAEEGCRFQYVDEILFCHRRHADTKTANSQSEMATEQRECQRRYREEFGTKFHLLRTVDLGLLRLFRLRGLAQYVRSEREDTDLAVDREGSSVGAVARRTVASMLPSW